MTKTYPAPLTLLPCTHFGLREQNEARPNCSCSLLCWWRLHSGTLTITGEAGTEMRGEKHDSLHLSHLPFSSFPMWPSPLPTGIQFLPGLNKLAWLRTERWRDSYCIPIVCSFASTSTSAFYQIFFHIFSSPVAPRYVYVRIIYSASLNTRIKAKDPSTF